MSAHSFQSCIEACDACALACDTCASACLQEHDVNMMAECIAHDIDCAAICRLASGYMARNSPFASLVCQACADICDACALVCAQRKAKHCQECAAMCRRCTQECRAMVAGMAQQAR